MTKNLAPSYNKHKIEGFAPEAHCTKHNGVQISNKFPEYLYDSSSVPLSRIQQLNNAYLARQISIDKQQRRQKIWNKLQNNHANIKRYHDKMVEIGHKQGLQKQKSEKLIQEINQTIAYQVPSNIRLPFIELDQESIKILNNTLKTNCINE